MHFPTMQDKYRPKAYDRFTEEKYFNEALFESKNFKIIPSLGSLIEGWLLVLPKSHYISFGAINNDDLYRELETLLNYISPFIEQEYGKYVIFEHGPVKPETVVGCGVDYAHLHIVPMEIDLIQKSSKHINENIWTKIPNLGFTSTYYNSSLPYLLVQDHNKNTFIGTDDKIPSQLFRQIIAEHLGISNQYDWKAFPFVDNINKTISTFSRFAKDIHITRELQHERHTK
jgi:ATP adenylyltransferase